MIRQEPPEPPASDSQSGTVVRMADGSAKTWSEVQKDEKLDAAALHPLHSFECCEQKQRGAQKLSRQLLVFTSGIALLNSSKFKWYRPHQLLSRTLVGQNEDDLLVLEFSPGALDDVAAESMSVRLLTSDRQQVAACAPFSSAWQALA